MIFINKLEVPIWKKVNLTVEEAVLYSNIGENKLRELLNTPDCPFVIMNGKKKLVKRELFEKWNSQQITI